MPLNDSLTVTVHLSTGDTLGAVMSRIRTWLDGQKIQAATFTTAPNAASCTLTIGFRNSFDADRFRQEFSAPA
jgi:hypothetical protein